MGCLESGVPLKKGSLFGSPLSSGRNERHPSSQRFRSILSRFLFKRLDYIQWICTVAVFFLFVVIFQMFLPGSVLESSEDSSPLVKGHSGRVLHYTDIEKDLFDFGEDITFRPRILEKFHKDAREADQFNWTRQHFGYRKPQLAMVFGQLLPDSQQLLMVSVAAALLEIGYAVKVYTLEDGLVHIIWKNLGVPVAVIERCDKSENTVDWLNYAGILVNAVEAKGVFSCFLQEPFKSIPLVWTIHENALAYRSREYLRTGQIEILNDWKRTFNRSTVVVFPNYAMPMIYSMYDAGNFFVIPGSPPEAWGADTVLNLHEDNQRVRMGYGPEDIVIAIVGSQFFYRGLWLGHSIVLQALSPLLAEFPLHNNRNPQLQIIILSGESTNNYSVALEAIAYKLKYPRGTVKHIAGDLSAKSVLGAADLVIYGSFLEEQSFPESLMKAMSLGKPVVAPDISVIKKHVDDRVNGYIFPKDNSKVLTQIVREVILKGKTSPLAHNIASIARTTAKNLMVSEAIEGYASLLQNILKFASEVAPPKDVSQIPPKLKEQWQWHLFEASQNLTYINRTSLSYTFLDKYEEEWNQTQNYRSGFTVACNDSFVYSIWEEEKRTEMTNTRRRTEEEELKDRMDQSHGTWDEVYRSAKRADRSKNDLHERDEGELERTGQPLCIYEPYFGQGTWAFLHRRSLYRGIGLSTKGRRPEADDIDAPSRLPLLSNPHYRDILGEFGAFFAIANRVDRIHKNAWIGFQSWRATARGASLSRTAENALIDAIERRSHGNALYFWVRMDMDPRNPLKKDFWSFCDSINAGNCKSTFSESFNRMYGIKNGIDSLPPMPLDGDTWSVMQSWVMPTSSFLEFVMFSRMFVDAMDAHMYSQHHSSGQCSLSTSRDKYCYSRLLELLVNVWAYHSAKRIIYINPESGHMLEQHRFKGRRGNMWIKWFSYSTLKSMDEDLADLADSGNPDMHWLWPTTGEVFWQGIYERERHLRNREKEKRKLRSKEKQTRMRNRYRQKAIGKYVKPPPEAENLNASRSTAE